MKTKMTPNKVKEEGEKFDYKKQLFSILDGNFGMNEYPSMFYSQLSSLVGDAIAEERERIIIKLAQIEDDYREQINDHQSADVIDYCIKQIKNN